MRCLMTDLPIYKIKGRFYYRDKRLGEYRNINDFNDRISSDDGDSLVETPTKQDNEKLWKKALKR